MKLLFDENLSPQMPARLQSDFPGSAHVLAVGLGGFSGEWIWDFARQHDFTIISKDNDFRQLSFLWGGPPKVIWRSVGNAGTDAIEELVRSRVDAISAFESDEDSALLVLTLGPEGA